MQTELDPEQALRKRLRGQLLAEPADPIGFGPDTTPIGGGGDKGAPIPSAPFSPVGTPTQPQRPVGPMEPIGAPNPAKPAPVIPPEQRPWWDVTQAPPIQQEPGDTGPVVPAEKPTQWSGGLVTPGTITTAPAPIGSGTATSLLQPGGGGIDEKTGGDPHPTYTVNQATTQSQAPGGWDQTKWDDASHTTTKYVVGRILAKYPPTVQGLQQAFAEIKAQFPGASFNGKDTLSGLPGTAGPVDVLMNASSGGSGWWWGDSGASGGAGGGGGASASTGAGGAATTNTATMPTSPFLQQLRDLLMQRIAAAQTPVNESDEYIAGPLSAGRDEVSRGQDAERKALAERLYAQGDLNSGALTQQIQQSSERNSTALSQLRAGLISKDYSAKRDELQNYMQLAIASGDAEMARQLQLEIANLNASVQREGLGINWAEFLAALNERTATAGLRG